MEKLKIAIIGQGRSGRNIHGRFFKSEDNTLFDVALVIEKDEERAKIAKSEYPGCDTSDDYRDIFKRDDIDLVVNASFSEMHYAITKDLLEHGKNVIVEKPFARNYYECCDLINIARDNGVVLNVFQQSFLAPYFIHAKELADSGKLGDIKQVSVFFNGFARRWDWQTLQSRMGGNAYNTGPHPIGLALAFLGFDENVKVEYSKLDRGLTSGDADDYAKIILTAPGKPVVDVEISSLDAFCDFNVKIQGSRGTHKTTITKYQTKYIVDGENPERAPIYESIKLPDHLPTYCSETLVAHDESGEHVGTSFDIAVRDYYTMMYNRIKFGTPLTVTPEMAAKVISVIETIHAQNPLSKEF